MLTVEAEPDHTLFRRPPCRSLRTDTNVEPPDAPPALFAVGSAAVQAWRTTPNSEGIGHRNVEFIWRTLAMNQKGLATEAQRTPRRQAAAGKLFLCALCVSVAKIENARTTGKPPEVVEAETAGIPAAAQIFFLRDDFGFNMGMSL